MGQRKLNYILGGLLVISLVVIAFLLGRDYSNIRKLEITEIKSNKDTSENSVKRSNSKLESNQVIESSNGDVIRESTETITDAITDETQVRYEESQAYINSENNETISYTRVDNEVIEEVKSIDDVTAKLMMNEEESTAKEKAKAIFVKLVDFAFYGGELSGHTFNELSDSGKQKVLKLINSLDEKIENSISSTASAALKKASEVIKNGANNINEFSREKLGEENYQSIIDAKDEMVNYYKDISEIVKDKGGNILSKTKDKIKSWYENFRNN